MTADVPAGMVRMEHFERRSFRAPTAGGAVVTHDVYTRGSAAATIVILQELPGIGPATLSLAEKLWQEGFRVVLPHLFGPLGKEAIGRNLVRVLCMRREFHLFRRNGTSPVVDWLRALCRDLIESQGASGVGVIGMCLTGNFAISLMAEESVRAGVASQPSLPLFGQRHLHMSTEDIGAVRDRLDQEGPMMALRFEGDTICRAEKFERLDAVFNDNRERIRLTELPGSGHSVLTRDFTAGGEPAEKAFRAVLEYFRSKLQTSS